MITVIVQVCGITIIRCAVEVNVPYVLLQFWH